MAHGYIKSGRWHPVKQSRANRAPCPTTNPFSLSQNPQDKTRQDKTLSPQSRPTPPPPSTHTTANHHHAQQQQQQQTPPQSPHPHRPHQTPNLNSTLLTKIPPPQRTPPTHRQSPPAAPTEPHTAPKHRHPAAAAKAAEKAGAATDAKLGPCSSGWSRGRATSRGGRGVGGIEISFFLSFLILFWIFCILFWLVVVCMDAIARVCKPKGSSPASVERSERARKGGSRSKSSKCVSIYLITNRFRFVKRMVNRA